MAERKASSTPLQVGVLFIPPIQLLDVSPCDLFGMLTTEYLQSCNLPAPLVGLGIDVNIEYIAPASAGTFVEATSNCALRVTKSLTDDGVQPGQLDVLLIPGPDPNLVPDQDIKKFIQGHAASAKTDILTVCTGIFPAGYSGILDGKSVTGPRGLVRNLKKKFPEANWSEKRWTQDGRLWTSANITNGQDMVAAYIRANFKTELADMVCAFADVGGRGQDFGNNSASETAWWVWLICRSWWKGKPKSK